MYAQPWGKVLLLEEKRDEGGFRGRVTSTSSGSLFSGGLRNPASRLVGLIADWEGVV